jgi:hypothetical protein
MIPSVVKKWSRRQERSRGGLEDLYDHSIKAGFQYAFIHTPCPIRCWALDRAVTMATAVSDLDSREYFTLSKGMTYHKTNAGAMGP